MLYDMSARVVGRSKIVSVQREKDLPQSAQRTQRKNQSSLLFYKISMRLFGPVSLENLLRPETASEPLTLCRFGTFFGSAFSALSAKRES